MRKKIILLLLGFVFFQNAFAGKYDTINYKHRWFAYWGYNRAKYTNSDIHINADNYNLVFSQVKAVDKPFPFSPSNYFAPTRIWVPQYNYRLGYNITERISISVGLDHMKYVIDPSQSVVVNGDVSNADFPLKNKFPKTYSETAMKVGDGFFYLDHTNGLNLVSADLDYRTKLYDHHFIKINLNNGFGLAAMIPKSEVHLMGHGIDNAFHLAGYAVSFYEGVEFVFGKYFFIRPQLRMGWINLPNILINSSAASDRGHQNFAFAEGLIVAGSYFQINHHKK